MAVTYRDLCLEALQELQMYQAGDIAPPEDLEFAQKKLVRLLDNWNADRRAVYAEVFETFTLTPSLSPHTIGPTGTWVTAQRPETIDGMNLVLTGSITAPIALQDYQWWLANANQTLTSAIPTDCYYEPAWPNGKLYFWPVPTTVYGVQIVRRVVLDSAFAIGGTFTLPPGYRDAITLTLAEDLVSSFGVAAQPSPALPTKAREARQRVFGANTIVPRIRTADDGVPDGTGGNLTTFDYRSRTF